MSSVKGAEHILGQIDNLLGTVQDSETFHRIQQQIEARRNAFRLDMILGKLGKPLPAPSSMKHFNMINKLSAAQLWAGIQAMDDMDPATEDMFLLALQQRLLPEASVTTEASTVEEDGMGLS